MVSAVISVGLTAECVQQYWARTGGLYRYVPVREFAQAYKQSKAGEDQARALKREFRPCGNADSALAWTKHALTGKDLFSASLLLDTFSSLHRACDQSAGLC